ncbi:major facilitator superfamily domain-containing protein [Tricladium varicosporioides]|nr:major facilitator superfamily domain-containing protein [Hymenoscyphus varicosporioides]
MSPLLACTSERQYGGVGQVKSLVDFHPDGDPDNPMDWSKTYRMGIVTLLSFMAFTVTFSCIGIVPVADQIIFDLEGRESKSASILLVTVWELGEAAGPLLIAPLSEIYGRYAVFNVANVIFILGVALSALSQSTHFLIFARFLTGLAVASNVLGPAIIGDIFPSEQRSSGMSLIMLAPLLGGAIGPAISGAIAASLGWRKILWISALLAIVCETLFFTLMQETYKVSILRCRAAKLRKRMNDETLLCEFDDEEGAKSAYSALGATIKRPLSVVWDSLVLKIMAFHGGLVFAFYYILATTLPGILKDTYGFSPPMIGLSFLAFSAGASVGIVACNLLIDRIYIKLGKSHQGPLPEHRLPFMIGGAIIFPIIIGLYGWAPYAHWSVYAALMAVASLGFVMMLLWVPLASYIVDAFGLYSASAMTMILIARCLGGTLLPLGIPPLTEAVGLGYGFLLLGAGCIMLIPLPIAIMRYGPHWRQLSEYTRTN